MVHQQRRRDYQEPGGEGPRPLSLHDPRRRPPHLHRLPLPARSQGSRPAPLDQEAPHARTDGQAGPPMLDHQGSTMSKREFKECWESLSFKDIEWYWRPMGFMLAILNWATCAAGLHSLYFFP